MANIIATFSRLVRSGLSALLDLPGRGRLYPCSDGPSSSSSSGKEGDDEHHHEDEKREGHNILASSSSQVPKISDGMAEKLREIRKRLDEIEKERNALHLREEDGVRRTVSAHNPRLTSSLIDESSIIGRESEKEKIVNLLLSELETSSNSRVNNKITVIPIVGMGGVGKTTLAQLIYNDPRIHQYFHLRLWIYVSEDFDLVKLTREIYRSITNEPCDEDVGFDYLQDTVKKELMKFKRIFMVFDDAWNEKHCQWDSLLVPFRSACIVNILLTTRNEKVADVMRTMNSFHLSMLSKDEAIHDQSTNNEAPKGTLVYPFLSKHVALRSIFYYGQSLNDDFQFIDSMRLRALLIESFQDDSNFLKFLGSIASLKHLRYLFISIEHARNRHFKDVFSSLFSSSHSIHNLQVLDLFGCGRSIMLPKSIKNLINLRHLILPDGSIMPCGISKLTGLQTLKNVDVIDQSVECGELGEIEDLASLTGSCCIKGVYNAHDVEGLKKANINRKEHIWRLSIAWRYTMYYSVVCPFDVHIFIASTIRSEKQTFELTKAKLEALRPHNNLKEFGIYGYPGLQFPLWLGDPSYSKLQDITLQGCNEWDGSGRVLDRDLPCLRSISIIGCAKLKNIKIYQSSSLRRLFVKKCPKITTLHGLCSLHRLEKLEIIKCYNLFISAEETLPSKLQFVWFEKCSKLKLITGLQNLHSLKELRLKRCPKLELSLEEQLSTKPDVLEIIDCPELKKWCQRYGFEFILESLKELFARSSKQIKLWLEEASVLFVNICVLDYDGATLETEKWPAFQLLGFYICSCVHLKSLSLRKNFTRLKQLRIWDCSHLEELFGLDRVTTLQDIDISNCPNLLFLSRFPKSLQCLAIDRCNKLRSLDCQEMNLSSLEISSCSTLNELRLSQASICFLKISNCPELYLQNKLLHMLNPNNVEISACPQLQKWCQKQDVAYI
ncbi:hypothetical protein M5K25_001064 [Dendrobium thyrsiflorum]|uniref:NB-ARC domain-containing protein n=1 Tax=Dendrobium thyrsiflorum TaxID=117978 RepID=A0ABD0WC89_DENTH